MNPLTLLLTNNKLENGDNFNEWRRNLDIVLQYERISWVLTENEPTPPSEDSTPEQVQQHERWQNADKTTKCYILASVSGMLQKQIACMKTASAMVHHLHEMFGVRTRSARVKAIQTFHNLRQKPGEPVRDYMMKVISAVTEAEMLGADMDADTQMIMIINSLNSSFQQFKLDYELNSKDYTLSELMNTLQSTEEILNIKAHGPEANVASSSKPKGKGKEKKKGPMKKKAQTGVKAKSMKKKAKENIKGKCFHCDEMGHWKRNCPVYLESLKSKQGMGFLSLLGTRNVADLSTSWILDSGATNHVCNSLQGFQQRKRLPKGQFQVKIADGSYVSAESVGVVILDFPSSHRLYLEDVYYMPMIVRNMISVFCLIKSGYSLYFEKVVSIYENKDFICDAITKQGLFFIEPMKGSLNTTELIKPRQSKISSINSKYLWHLRMGHINQKRLDRLVKDGILMGLDSDPLPTCESCIEGKMTKASFPSKGNRSESTLDLVHTDVCGPMNVHARGGYEYFIIFIDDYSRHGYLYLMHKKSESFEKFKEFKAEAEKQLGKPLKQLRSDRGGEYLSGEFQQYLIDNGIVSNLSAPRTPQQNGVAERRNRTLLEMVRSMMSYASLPESFWGYAIQTATYLLNFAPSKSVPKTPRELWTGRVPSLRHLRTWGCPAHVLKPESTKMEPRSEVCLFVGYPTGTRGYYFYSPHDKKVFVSTNATFLEEEFVKNHKGRSEVVLKELAISSKPRVVLDMTEQDVEMDSRVESEVQPEHQGVPRRSGRVVRQPDRYLGLGEGLIAISDQEEIDPITYTQAINDVDAGKWLKAMESEIDSMYTNEVWVLVDLPPGLKAIGCKWIYKRKRGSDGKVETFKARLVAKGYTQKEGIDYEETFSPVAMLKSIRILLAIAAYFDYEIWQMDVKTAFLNGDLEETIYMAQPEGFIEPGNEHKVCKLQRSIYGLKQASRSWNIRFDKAIKTYGFIQNLDEPCVYKRIQEGKVTFLILYVDDILLIGNDVGMLSAVKGWLNEQFSMKDLGEATYVLGIKLIRDRKKKQIALSQLTYIENMLNKFAMQDSKKGFTPTRHGIKLSKEQAPKTQEEVERMRNIPYASAVGSLMYAMLCTRPDICYAVGLVSRFQSNPGMEHWTAVKCILKYLRRTKNLMLVYSGSNLIPTGYTDSDFQSDVDSRKSTSGSIFTLGGGAIVWRSVKQSCIADSTMEAEYVAACEAAKEAVWLRKFLNDLEVVPEAEKAITLYCDNSGAVANSKEPRNHKAAKHIERKYHLIREIIQRGEVDMVKIPTEQNLADPFTKTLTQKCFEGHLEGMGMRDMSNLL